MIRSPCEVEEFITFRRIDYPASRDDFVKFAEGKKASICSGPFK